MRVCACVCARASVRACMCVSRPYFGCCVTGFFNITEASGSNRSRDIGRLYWEISTLLSALTVNARPHHFTTHIAVLSL